MSRSIIHKRARNWCGFALMVGLFGLAFSLSGGDSQAADPDIKRKKSTQNRDETDTIASKPIPVLKGGQYIPPDQAQYEARLMKHQGREYPAVVYVGAEMLDMDPRFVATCRTGMELIYQRDYPKAKAHFDKMGVDWSGTGVSPVGQLMVWQAMMLENFDFKYESQYRNSYRRARQELEQALLQPGNDAWEHFLLGAVLGVEAIHTMRHEEYLSALNQGYEAMKSIKRARELAPQFKDALLGDGLFNYWSSVISLSSKAIPDLPDNRTNGIQQMMTVEQQAIFLGPPAGFALTFTWIEENRKKTALEYALKNHRIYPNNVINNLILGRIYLYSKKLREAERILLHNLEVAPKNQRSHYYLGRVYLRWGKLDKALKKFDAYLGFSDLNDDQRAWALYYRGNVYYAQKNYVVAETNYKESWKVGKVKRAKARLERIAKKRDG